MVKRTNNNFCSRSCAGSFNGRKRKLRFYKVGEKIYQKIRELRKQNYGYRTIANMFNVPHSTIRNWVKDIKTDRNESYRLAQKIKLKPIEALVNKGSIRKRLFEERGYKCELCNLSEWMSKNIILEIHHKDGNNKNNTLKNLQILCPNCHSQTWDYRNKKRI